MRVTTGEYYSIEQASQHADAWCQKHKGWKRICDIPDSDVLYFTWDELPDKVKKPWICEYRDRAETAWLEFGKRPCKVKAGHISGKGEFYKDILDIPLYHNSMMVFKVG